MHKQTERSTQMLDFSPLDLLPMRGLSEVIGMIDETVFRKMVSDRRMVTPNKLEQQIDVIRGSVRGTVRSSNQRTSVIRISANAHLAGLMRKTLCDL